MSANRIKPAADVPAAAADEAAIDAFIARNREVLDESIERSRAEIAAGVHDARSMDDIIAEGRKRRGARLG